MSCPFLGTQCNGHFSGSDYKTLPGSPNSALSRLCRNPDRSQCRRLGNPSKRFVRTPDSWQNSPDTGCLSNVRNWSRHPRRSCGRSPDKPSHSNAPGKQRRLRGCRFSRSGAPAQKNRTGVPAPARYGSAGARRLRKAARRARAGGSSRSHRPSGADRERSLRKHRPRRSVPVQDDLKPAEIDVFQNHRVGRDRERTGFEVELYIVKLGVQGDEFTVDIPR